MGGGARGFAALKKKFGQFCDFFCISRVSKNKFLCPKTVHLPKNLGTCSPQILHLLCLCWELLHSKIGELISWALHCLVPVTELYKSTFQDVHHWITLYTITKLWKSKQKLQKRKRPLEERQWCLVDWTAYLRHCSALPIDLDVHNHVLCVRAN